MDTLVIVNPAANKGNGARRWPAWERSIRALIPDFAVAFTDRPGHATALARAGLERGVRRFLAVGGDGTVNETLNGLLDEDGRLRAEDAVLCPIPAGTANELCRTLGTFGDPMAPIRAASSGRTRPLDLLEVRCTGLDGAPVRRFGYLIVSLGAAATIAYRTSQSRWVKKLGSIAYLVMTPPVTLGYRHRGVAISIDGAGPETRTLFTAMVANTENGGGGMKLMPGAQPDDGVLELIEMGDISRLGILLNVLPKLYDGSHVKHPGVRVSRGTSFRFDSAVETLVDLDGETVGRLPLEVRVLPRAFHVGVA